MKEDRGGRDPYWYTSPDFLAWVGIVLLFLVYWLVDDVLT